MDFLPLLGGALGGAILTSLFGIWKARRDKDTEHRRWLRDAKQVAYVEFINSAKNLLADAMLIPQYGTERVEWGKNAVLALRPTAIFLLAPKDIRKLVQWIHGDLLWLSSTLSRESVGEPHIEKRRTQVWTNLTELEGLLRKDLRVT